MARTRSRPDTVATAGALTVERDPRRPSGRLLRQGATDASYVDLADPTHLEFDYLRWLRVVLRAARARRVLHLGGGACTLARALAVEDPGGRQDVAECDGDVLDLARSHLGLGRTPGLRVRHADGRDLLAGSEDAGYDAIAVDAFLGARVAPTLTTAEAALEMARVASLAIVNVVDDRRGTEVAAVAAALAGAYPRVWALGARVGNTLVAGDRGTPPLGLISARAAADPSPARLTPPAAMAARAGATRARRDND